jgi:hypothetical protein
MIGRCEFFHLPAVPGAPCLMGGTNHACHRDCPLYQPKRTDMVAYANKVLRDVAEVQDVPTTSAMPCHGDAWQPLPPATELGITQGCLWCECFVPNDGGCAGVIQPEFAMKPNPSRFQTLEDWQELQGDIDRDEGLA